jgi:pimeloyl-ACP methyl ester carboxylesterase
MITLPTKRSCLAVVAAAIAGLYLASRLHAQTTDPVAADPAPRDTAFPAALVELALTSGGARMNGFLLVAQGKGPHPLVVLLHGYPGNERNIDVAQALRRAGTNVLYFDYRGSWGSGGTFSFANAQADVAAALRWARAADTASHYRIDARRIALVGHSMGGWLALLGASADRGVACVAGIEFADMTHGGADTSFATYTKWLTAPGGPLRGDWRAMTASLRAHATDWKLTTHARALADRPVLLLDNGENAWHADLVAALKGAGAKRLTEYVWPTDHSFDDRRVELTRTVVGWTKTACGF